MMPTISLQRASRNGLCAGLLLCLLCSPSGLGAFDEVIDTPMYQDPKLPMGRVEYIFPERAKELWLMALKRPEVEWRCKAADTIASAHSQGIEGMDSTIPALVEAFRTAKDTSIVRVSTAKALIALEANDHASLLFEAAQKGTFQLRHVVEPAVARWKHRPAEPVWLARLADEWIEHRDLILAIRGLVALGSTDAVEPLQTIALAETQRGSIRLEAARALGQLRQQGLESAAKELVADPSRQGMVNRLVAVTLLQHHSSSEAIAILQGLSIDPEPTVARRALDRLIEIDPKLAEPKLANLLDHPDAMIRLHSVHILGKLPTPEHIQGLGDKLDDAHPEVRIQARKYLRGLGEEEQWHEAVIAQGMRLVNADDWRGQEQAAILLAQLNHKPARTRLIELLESPQPEVFVIAAWGLRQLAVPDTLPKVLAYVDGQLKRLVDDNRLSSRVGIPHEMFDHQLSQLNQLLGKLRYQAADSVMRQFIPLPMAPSPGPESRAAAVWTLGLLHEDKPDAQLVKAFQERLDALSAIPPEDTRVGVMAAISLGRMNAKAALETLDFHYASQAPSLNPVNNAAGWAISRITGEPIAEPHVYTRVQRNWFIAPLDN